jgi:phenylpyruvate tautomerase PptA (4-oxalocrotonate tautomerase family)
MGGLFLAATPHSFEFTTKQGLFHMPYLSIQTNVEIADKQTLITEASKTLASALNKSEMYVMVAVRANVDMSFAASYEPCAYLELKSIALPEQRSSEFSEIICSFIEKHLGIPSNRIYIEFATIERHLWGWDSRTF